MLRKLLFIGVTLLFACMSTVANAEEDYGSLLNEPAGAYNSKILGIVTGGIGGTYIQIGSDLGKLSQRKSDLRLMTYVGAGSATNILDLLKRIGVDFAIVQSDVLAHIEKNYPGNEEIAKLAYISKIYNEEVHLVGRADAAPKSIADLKGLKVNIGSPGSGTRITAQLLLDYLDIKVQPTEMSNADALEALKKGEIDAMIFVAGRPTSLFKSVTREDKLALLEIPFLPALEKTYARAEFKPEDYPALVTDKFVPTISVSAILVVYDNFVKGGERYANIDAFTKMFFKNIPDLQSKDYHPKWKEIDVKANVPGWKRFHIADEILAGDQADNKANEKAGEKASDKPAEKVSAN